MTEFRSRSALALIAIAAFFAFGQQASAQNDAQSKIPFHVRVVPRAAANVGPDVMSLTAPVPNLYPLSAGLTASSNPTYVNTDGTDLWVCLGVLPSGEENPDCSTIGNPSIQFPAGGIVVGVPSYTWSLSNCNATSFSSPPCGQLVTFYEDATNDSTDDLLFTIVVTQGTGESTTWIYDSGTIDFGPNQFIGKIPPSSIVYIFGDTGLGNEGVTTGPNNGNCFASANYPSATDPATALFTITANKTCSPVAAGLATFTVTTEIATPHYTKHTTVASCGFTTPPCYTVTYTKKYSITQKWNIWFE
jgi:hypothetical protein